MDEEELPKPDNAEGKDDPNLLILEQLIKKAGSISDPLKSAVKANALSYLKAIYTSSLTIKDDDDYQKTLDMYKNFVESLKNSEIYLEIKNIDEEELQELTPVISVIEDALKIANDERIVTPKNSHFASGSTTNDPSLPSQE